MYRYLYKYYKTVIFNTEMLQNKGLYDFQLIPKP